MARLLLLGLALWHGLSTASPVPWQPETSELVVDTSSGAVHGVSLPEFNQDLFLGIKYAEAPRLDNPILLNDSYSSSVDASTYGYTCPGFGSNQVLPLTQNEDCLNINVVRPAGCKPSDKLPILLWIYGGGFRQGSSADPNWNLSYIVQESVKIDRPIIGMSINYRLSFLGYPAGKEVLDAGVTNLGHKDQRAALQWVQLNAAAFGGDPTKVTIWGESAGGASVAGQLTSYGGQGGAGLFRAGIMVSGFSTGINPSLATGASSQMGYDTIVANAGCNGTSDTLACLRTAPFESIYTIEDNTTGYWQPVIDGAFFRQPIGYEVAGGHVHPVPILLGHNSDEGLFAINGQWPYPNTTADTTLDLERQFPNASSAIINQILTDYPATGPFPPYVLPASYPWCAALNAVGQPCGAQYRRLAGILGDHFVDGPRRYMARNWVKLGLPAYSFRFDTDPTDIPIHFFPGLGPGFALHGSELDYEFGQPAGFTTGYPPVKPVVYHVEVSKEMLRRWVGFAWGLDPNDVPGNNLTWPAYSESASNFVFNATNTALNLHIEPDTYREAALEIWIENVATIDYAAYGPPF